MRPEEPDELGFSAPAQRPAQQPRADNPDPRANRVPTESQMSDISETGGHESASAPRRRTGHEEITDLAYEAADHAQDFAEEIEDAVSPNRMTCPMPVFAELQRRLPIVAKSGLHSLSLVNRRSDT